MLLIRYSLKDNDGDDWNLDEIPALTAPKVLPNDWEASPFKLNDGELDIDGNKDDKFFDRNEQELPVSSKARTLTRRFSDEYRWTTAVGR